MSSLEPMEDPAAYPNEKDGLMRNNNNVDAAFSEEDKPRKNPCLHGLHFVQFLVMITLLTILAAQVLPLFFMSPKEIGRIQMVLR